MKGFFDIEEVEEEVMKPKPRKVKREVVYSCESCGLYKKCNSPKMKVQGNGKQGILVIIDPPTLKADRLGKTYVGQTRYLLKELCANAELDLQDDVYMVNSIQCHHKETNKATIPTCRERLCAIIDELKPKAVVAMGTSAISVLFNELITIGAVSRWDGWEIPFRNTVVYTTYGIQDILMYKENVVLMGKVTNQLKRAKEAPPYVDYVDKADKAVEILTKAKDIQNMLLTMETKDIVAFDYETTGLQPYKQGHKIISMSVSDGVKSYAFLISKTVEPYVKHFLHSPVKKVAHNAKYEIQWSMHFFDGIENVVADTMNDAHLLNNAKAIVKLEFQAFVNFGIPDYSTDIKHLITSDAKEGPHAFNKLYYMEQSGDLITVARDLLYYNAVDSLVTAWLYNKQEAVFSSDPFLQGGRNLFFQAMLRFAKIEYRGMSIDHKKVKKNIKEIDNKLKVLYNMIYDTDEVGQWTHEYPFKFSSPMHLADLLFTTLGYKVLERTNGGAPSVEAPTLEKLNEEVGSELITLIISYRKLEKMKTYLEGIDRGALDGRLHTSFNLHKALSYRSCVAKGTKILVYRDAEEHPDGIPIEDVREGDLVYCFDDNLHPTLSKVLWSGKTGYREVVRVHYVSQGKHKSKGYVDVTPEHKIRTIHGDYVEARNLMSIDTRTDIKRVPKRRVLSAFRRDDKVTFTGNTKNNNGLLEHRLVYEYFHGKISDVLVIHHKNGNHKDNSIDNLILMTKEEHSFHHGVSKRKDTENLIPDKDGIFRIKDNREEKAPKKEYVQLTRTQTIRLLIRSKGHIKKTSYSYDIMRRHAEKYNINVRHMKLRYDIYGNYISKNRALRLSKEGRTHVKNELGFNFYKVKELYEMYDIDPERKWANQFGEFAPNNHIITEVEYISKKVDVYDLEVEHYHNFIANEICVHNSSSGINFQNIPKRSVLGRQYIRSVFTVGEKYIFEEIDFNSLEVNIGNCYHQDPMMIEYLNNEDADMHADVGCQLVLRDRSSLLKEERQTCKGSFVFAEQYGDYYVACARNLWKNFKPVTKKHLASKGYKTLDQYTELVKQVEDDFWNNRFKVFGQWRKDNYETYLKKGYLDFYTGFRSTAFLSKNQANNIPIQGSAFHCLLWVLIYLYDKIEEEGLDCHITGQIHDSIAIEVNPEDANRLHVMTSDALYKLKEYWQWITAPLSMGYDQSPVGGTWLEAKEKGVIR